MDETVCYDSHDEENDSDITYVESTDEEIDNIVNNPLQHAIVQQGPTHQVPTNQRPTHHGPTQQGPKEKPSKINNNFVGIVKVNSDTNSNADPYFFAHSESD